MLNRTPTQEEPSTTPPESVDGSDPGAPPNRPRYALPALCATQIIGWGILYYAFPVMLPAISHDTGWPANHATAAFSGALIVSALAGIPIGHLIDRGGPRRVMTAGSVVGAAALALVAAAPTVPLFAAGWLLAGLAMAATFYQPAFAALTRWYGTRRVRALTTLTLAGGLASTIFAPTTAVLAQHLGWRHATLMLAAILLLAAAPLHWIALRGPWPRTTLDARSTAAAGHPPGRELPASATDPQAVLRSRGFLTLAGALTLSGFAMYGVVFSLIPLLTQRGATTTQAAWALGLGGLGQTLGRLVYAPLAARTSPRVRTTALIAAGGLSTAMLATVTGPLWLLTGIAMAAGTVRGNLTLLQATAVTDRWGTHAYGRLTATLTAPVTIAGALAPWAGAALTGPVGGYTHLFYLLAVASACAAILTLSSRGRGRKRTLMPLMVRSAAPSAATRAGGPLQSSSLSPLAGPAGPRYSDGHRAILAARFPARVSAMPAGSPASSPPGAGPQGRAAESHGCHARPPVATPTPHDAPRDRYGPARRRRPGQASA